MEFYFTDRQYNVLGVASTGDTASIRMANETEQQSTDAATTALAGTLYFTRDLLTKAKDMAQTGNYILYRDDQNKDQFSTILESHVNAATESITFAGDSAGNDLRNETVNSYTASKAMKFADYFATFATDSGWEIGLNEASDLTRTLSWDGEETAYDRLNSLATEFGVYVDFSFTIDGTNPVKRYVNVHRTIGADNDVTLTVGKELNSITIDTDMYDTYNAVLATGGTPDGSDKPITLAGYKWTDPTGRYVLMSNGSLRDTVSVKQWSRLRSNSDPTPNDSYLNKVKTYDATTQATLLQSALADLKQYGEPAVNYTVDVAYLPENVHKGDTVHLVDDEQDLHLSGTVLDITKSWSANSITATIGNYKIEPDQVNAQLKTLASNLKASTVKTDKAFSYASEIGDTAEQAKSAADTATKTATAAQSTASDASIAAGKAQTTANSAATSASEANSAASAAQAKADSAASSAAIAISSAKAASDAVATIEPAVNSATSDIAAAKSDAATALAQATAANSAAGSASSDVQTVQASVTKLSDGLAAKANQTDVDTLSKTVTSQGTSIDTNTKDIALKANQSDVDTLNNTVKTQGTSIDANSKVITAKADQATVDNLSAELDDAEQQITPDAITNTVLSSDDFNQFSDANDADKQALQNAIDGLNADDQATISRVSKVEQTAGAVKTTVDTMATKVNSQGEITNNIQNYMNFDDTGLTLGKSDSNLTITIDNKQMTFKDSGKQVAYVNGQKMYISDLQVLNSIQLGYHKIAKYSDDGETTAVTFVGK